MSRGPSGGEPVLGPGRQRERLTTERQRTRTLLVRAFGVSSESPLNPGHVRTVLVSETRNRRAVSGDSLPAKKRASGPKVAREGMRRCTDSADSGRCVFKMASREKEEEMASSKKQSQALERLGPASQPGENDIATA
ncbi:hypothetical protein MTO96_012664 [Rhipicephalus appendiculatus]